jgi:hypothetical protein
MQRRFFCTVAMAITVAFAASTNAQTATTTLGDGINTGGLKQSTRITATVVAIDPSTRTITLKGPKGNQMSIEAGPQVQNFAQIKPGDQVNVEYVEALTLELKKGSTAPVVRTEQTMAQREQGRDRPAGAVGRQVTVMAEVTNLNAATQMVTLRGPQRSVELKVEDPAQFKRLVLGDRVEATYTEAVAMAVEPAKN